MSEPLNIEINSDLRRLLEQPARVRRQQSRRLFSSTTMRSYVVLADTAQVILLGFTLRPFFPAAAETFSSTQSLELAVLAATLVVATRRALLPLSSGGLQTPQAIAIRAAISAFVAIALLALTCWVVLSRSVTPNAGGRTAWFCAWAVSSSLSAAGLRLAIARLGDRLESGYRVLVIGSPEHTAPIVNDLASAPSSVWRLAGSIDDRQLGALEGLVDTISHSGADLVVLALSGLNAPARIAAIVDRLVDQPVRVSLAPDMRTLVGVPRAKVRFQMLPLFDIANDPHGGLNGVAKRCLDIGLGLLILLLTAPIMLLVVLAIKLDSSGPVLFRQWRFGLRSQPIQVLKFRSMHTDQKDLTGARQTLARDPRVTRVGRILRRSSLDELPQLINVLRGDMSLVGPRPHPLHMRVGDIYYFDAVSHYRARHLVRPGLTGWAQIHGSRGEVDTLKKAYKRVELDLFYLDNWSIWLDMRILLATALGGFLSTRAD